MKDYPHPENPGQTHYEGCWKRPRHHNCAVARVYELEEKLKEARKQGMLDAAEIGRIVCYKTRHYTLGEDVADAIRRKAEEL